MSINIPQITQPFPIATTGTGQGSAVPNLGQGGTSTPASTLGTGGGVVGPIPMAPEVRQALTQILGMLQALAATLAPKNAGTGGTSLLGTGGTAGTTGTGGTVSPLGTNLLGTGGTAGTTGTGGTAGTSNPALSSFSGFSGVNGLNITALPNVPQLAQAPASFFTPIALPQQVAAPPVVAPVAAPQAKIPLTSGDELQQRIQLFDRSNPNNIAGLAQFLTNSYSNTSAFVPQADGTLLYSVSGKTFKIAATGLTPRVQVG